MVNTFVLAVRAFFIIETMKPNADNSLDTSHAAKEFNTPNTHLEVSV